MLKKGAIPIVRVIYQPFFYKPPHEDLMKKQIGMFTLAMINIAAIGSVKNWPLTAEYGLSSLSYLLLATCMFFLPVAFIAAELATTWPKNGGIYVWIKQAFGHRVGFFAIWLFWILNVIWYPTILSFIAATLAYSFNPSWSSHPLFIVITVLICLWGATGINLLGLKVSGWISIAGALFGTLIPAMGIIFLGILWKISGHPSDISLSPAALVPKLESVHHWVFFAGIILSLTGIEMSAIYAKNVFCPQKSYPRAILLSGALIVGLTALGVLAIATVVPKQEISLVSGALQAFSALVNSYGLGWLTPWIALLMAIGAFSSLSTWITGSSRGLLAAAKEGDLPPYFHVVNRFGMPKNLLLVQTLLVSFLSLLFILMPSVNSAFWILSALVTQLYLIVYLLLFAAALQLRKTRPDVKRPYKIPGGIWGFWTLCGLGALSSFGTFFIGFFPPSQIESGNSLFYVLFLFGGIFVACAFPFIILFFQRPSWKNLSPETK